MVNRQSMQMNIDDWQSLLTVGREGEQAKQEHSYTHGMPLAGSLEWPQRGNRTRQ